MVKRPRDLEGAEDLEALEAQSPAKYLELDEDDLQDQGDHSDHEVPHHSSQASTSKCSLLSGSSKPRVVNANEHSLTRTTQSHQCSSCGYIFPSSHVLNQHLDEHHNPLREELAIKGHKTYSCFVESCVRKCSSPQKRRLHLIDKHGFPKDYNFRLVDYGIGRSFSLLKGRQCDSKHDGKRKVDTTAEARKPSTLPLRTNMSEGKANDPDISGLEASLAALSFVPPSVQAVARRSKKQGRNSTKMPDN